VPLANREVFGIPAPGFSRRLGGWRTELEQVSSEEIAKAVRELGSAWRLRIWIK
jgi:hypothetical protein